jgi:hypothetical protein
LATVVGAAMANTRACVTGEVAGSTAGIGGRRF